MRIYATASLRTPLVEPLLSCEYSLPSKSAVISQSFPRTAPRRVAFFVAQHDLLPRWISSSTLMPLSYTSFSFFASRDPIPGHQPATRAIVAFDREYFDCVVDAREHNVRPPQVEFSAAVSSA